MIRLRTLGTLELRGSDGRELRSILAQPKRVALLAWLALVTPRGFHRRDTLLALFWPEHDAEHGRNSLSQSVHVLRQALGADAIVSRNSDALSLARENLWCDAIAFEEAIDGGRYADAAALYEGELLPGFHIGGAPDFERWLAAERERLARLNAGALEELANAREAVADFAGAVSWWRRLAARDAYSSRVALRLMRALAAAGDPAGAVQHARLHETLLREALEVTPDPEVMALARQFQSTRVEGAPRPEQPTSSPPAEPPLLVAVGGEEASRSSGGPHLSRRAAMFAAGLALLGAVGTAGAVLRARADGAAPRVRSLAVLPLEDLSADSTQRAFAAGLHDALITELARYPELTVISRTSVERYAGTKQSLPEIARELHVEGVIEGTVVREGGRVRMDAQLVDGATDRHLWAKSYTRDLRDVLDLQREVAEAIAREVRVAVVPPERRRAGASGPADSAPRALYVRELYLRGRHAENSRSLAGVQTAREAYERAIAADSSFALGYAGLAGVYGFLADYAYAPVGPALDSARIMARRAIALDSTLAETHIALAVTLGDAGWFAAAEREFRRAIELAPSDARAHYWYSVLLVALGRGEEALREANRAAALDPFAPRGLRAMQGYARYLLTGERAPPPWSGSARPPVLKLEPGEPWARASLAGDLAQGGRCDEARGEILRAQELAPDDNPRMLPLVGVVNWWCGDRAGARALVARIERRPDARDHGYRMARLFVLFGESDSALAWLGHQRWTMAQLSGLSADRSLDPLRSDPRFDSLLVRIGIRARPSR